MPVRRPLGSDAQRGILFIAYHFPPSAAVGGVRIANLAHGFSSLGWDTHVLTIRERDITQVDGDRLRGVGAIPIHRVRVLPTIEGLYDAIRRPRRVGGMAREASPREVRRRETRTRALKRGILSFLALPDRERGWLLPASLAAIREVRRGRLQWILTSCPPYSAHLVGLVVKAMTGVKWIVDFRDPWMTTGSKRLYPTSAASLRVESWLERKVIERSDLVSFSVNRLCAAYRERYRHVVAQKFVHVPNGIRRPGPAQGTSTVKYERFTLSYTGSLYLGRSPEPVFQAVAWLVREGGMAPGTCRIKLVGHCRGVDGASTLALARRYGLESAVEVLDPLSYEAAQEIIGRSHVALLFAPNQTYQVPAKFYDYLAAGARILAIAGDSATKDLVEETGSGEAFLPTDIEGIARFISREMAQRRAGQAAASRAVARFDIDRVTADLAAHLAGAGSASREARVS